MLFNKILLLFVLTASTCGAAAQQRATANAPAAKPSASVIPALPAVGSSFELRSATKDKSTYDQRSNGGKATLVMFWSTDCNVCKSKMASIRQETSQSQGKYRVVLVNTDRSWSTAESYEKIIVATQKSTGEQPIRIWRGETGYTDSVGAAIAVANKAPVAFVINKQARITEVITGRFDDTIWKRLAAL